MVTDDQGRFLLPELPPAQFDLWVRGYGLTDASRSAKAGHRTQAGRGRRAHAAGSGEDLSGQLLASLIELPAASEFPGTGPKGNGIRRA